MTKLKKTSLEGVKKEYTEGLSAWLGARSERDKYLIPKNSSDPRLTRIDQFTFQLVSMLPQKAVVVDLGFGPEGRDLADVIRLSKEQGKEIDALGFELVNANITSAMQNPGFVENGRNILTGKLAQGDITKGIPLPDSSADAIILSSVIQHMPPSLFYEKVVPELVGILKNGGTLQLIFKSSETESRKILYEDPTLGGKTREFWLYNPEEVVDKLSTAGLKLYEGDQRFFGGIIRWVDQNRPIPYAGMYLRKS